jgi:hypothetical protein
MLSRLGTALLASSALFAPAWAQQAPDNGTVGPAEIRDFSLPGSRPAPKEPEPTIAPVQAPRAEPTPAPAPTSTPAPTEPAPSQTPPAPVRAPEAVRPARVPERIERGDPAETAPVVQSAPTEILDAVRPPEATAPATSPLPAAPDLSAPVLPQAEPALPAEPEGGFPWVWLLAALGLGGAAFIFLRSRRRAATVGAPAEGLLRLAPDQPPKLAPAPERVAAPTVRQPATQPSVPQPGAPEPAGGVGIIMRPWLEIDFRPERAVATETGAEVRYEVTIRNTGNAPARNVRLAARMFSAGPELDREISDFFARPIDDRGAAPLTVLPRTDLSFQSVVTLPREQVREIRVEGRSLFVPTVAFNLLYDYGRGKTGQTCSSHVVGREAETPSAKMGPFRLDLGPRVWRSVGQRPSALARAV